MKLSVIMANYNGAAHIASAIGSVQRQTETDWELLVCDDASTDASAQIVLNAAHRDIRIRLLSAPTNSGAAAARNMGLDAARGKWVAIVDSDDLLHPERFARLLEFAEMGHSLVADDLVYVSDEPSAAGRTLLEGLAMKRPARFGVAEVLMSDTPESLFSSLGYTKLLFARTLTIGIRYNENLRVSEDFEFLLRLVTRAGALWVLPDPSYLYRRHSASLSYRTSVDVLTATCLAHREMRDWLPMERSVAGAYSAREAALERLLSFERLVDQIKGRRYVAAMASVARTPALIGELLRSLRERRARGSDAPMRTTFEGVLPLVATAPAPAVSEAWLEPPCSMAARLSAGERPAGLSDWFAALGVEIDRSME